MKIYITPLERIIVLQRENARLRALVGEAVPAPDPEENPGAEAEAPNTLVKKTDDLETAVGLIAEVIR